MMKLGCVVATLTTFVLLVSCGGADSTSGSDSKELKLAFVTNTASDFWTIARKGVEKADSELDGVCG
jgi:ABC-type sugar transport system substrate-binding protein